MTKTSWLRATPQAPEFFTQERCFITELHNDASIDECSVARARVEPGVRTQLHALKKIREIYIIEQGQGLVEIGGESAMVRPGDRVVIEPDVPQRITNTGAGDLVFLCICTPRFIPQAYEAQES